MLASATTQTFADTTGENNPTCRCANPNNPEAGKNGFICPNNPQPGFCKDNFFCQQINGVPRCENGAIKGGAMGSSTCLSLGATCDVYTIRINGAGCCGVNNAICSKDNKCALKTTNNSSTAPPSSVEKSQAEGNPKCHCTNEDSMNGNDNGFTCDADSGIANPGFCSPGFYCQNATQKTTPQCKNGRDEKNASICTNLNDGCIRGATLGSSEIKCCGTDTVCGRSNTCVKKTSPLANVSPLPPPNPCPNNVDVNGGCKSVNTALGPWNADPSGFVTSLFGYLLGLTGGIAVLIIVISGYKIMASKGDPEKVAGARETLTAAIVGLLFLIFSFVILQIIGVDILHIPGFGGGTSNTTTTAGANTNDKCPATYGARASCEKPSLCYGGYGKTINDPSLCTTGTVCCLAPKDSTPCAGSCTQSNTGVCPVASDQHDNNSDFYCMQQNNYHSGSICCVPATANGNQCGCTITAPCTNNGQYCQSTTANADGSYNIAQCQYKGNAYTWNFLYPEKIPACTPN